jgi:AcrR family transcriptional regulator
MRVASLHVRQSDVVDRDDLYAVTARAQAEPQDLGLRERHKIDKMERIAQASQRLFGLNGYDATTLREIAREAGVALGTLSLYTTDKRDLILLLFNKNIPILMEIGRTRVDPNKSLTDNMVAYFTPMYHAYASNLTLFRMILNHGNLAANTTSRHNQQFNRTRAVLVNALADIIRLAQSTGECAPSSQVDLQARSFFYIYFAAVRTWISTPEPQAKEGLNELKKLFDVHVHGLIMPLKPKRPKPGAKRVTSTG